MTGDVRGPGSGVRGPAGADVPAAPDVTGPRTPDPGPRTVTLRVTEGLHCASCVARLERHAAAQPGLVVERVDLLTRTAHLQVGPGLEDHTVIRYLGTGGFVAVATGAAAVAQEADTGRQRALLALVLAAGAVTADHLGQPALAVAASAAALAGPGRGLVASALGEWRRLAPAMDALVVLGAVAAVGLGIAGLLGQHQHHALAHTGAAVTALVLTGRWLEARARARAMAGVEALARQRPPEAWRVTDAADEAVALDAIVVGDRLRLRPGATVPVDGVVEEGSTEIDERLLTGEPLPVPKIAGDACIAGTVNGNGSIILRATSTGDGTTLARLAELVRTAQGGRPPFAGAVARIARWFTPAVLLLALATLAWWWQAGAPWSGLLAAATVLVAACPCALGLAAPAAVSAAASAAARRGIFLVTPRALEQAARVDTVLFDKTGTLTTGEFRLAGIWAAEDWGEDRVLALAAAAESGSEHPLGLAIRCAALERALALVTPERFRAEAGAGVEADLDGHTVVLGSAARLAERGIPLLPTAPPEGAGAVLVHVAVDGAAVGVLRLRDAVREEAAEAVARLQARGLDVHLVTGDTAANAETVARRLGITTVVARASPAAKLEHLRHLQAAGHRVALVGDGLNDAPALAAADLGIALGSGAEAATRAGDVVLGADDVAGVADLMDLGRATRWVILQNLVLAGAYNLLVLPAATGLVLGGLLTNPAIAAAAMAGSSLIVLLNALRLRIPRPDPRWRSWRSGITGVNAEMAASLTRFQRRWARLP